MTLPEVPPAQEPRRRPSTIGGVVYLLVCAASATGLAIVAFGPWRRGVTVLGVSLVVAGATRLVLSSHEAGMLRVRRSRWVDALMLISVGVVLLVLASSIPDQPGS